jgi:phosphoglycerol transferase
LNDLEMKIEKIPTQQAPGFPRFTQAACLFALCALVFTWLLLRAHGLGPAVFADEWYYSKMSRLLPVSEAIVPSYLYLWMFRSTNACGTGFLDCARVGNELLFVGAAPFLYLVARRVAGKGVSLLVALLAMLAPFNLYTAFFMPEAAYYFGFAVLSWVTLVWGERQPQWSWVRMGLATGVVLGVMSLIKVHALFLLPALAPYLIGAAWLRGETRWLARGVLAALLATAITFAFKFGLGYLLAGDAALSLFGSFYSGTASTHASRPLAKLLASAFINGRGHLMSIAVLQALPLAMMAQALLSRKARARSGLAVQQIGLFALLMLGATAGVTVLYTASIADAGPDEVLRLHLRYYSFVFPLMLVVAAAAIGKPAESGPTRGNWPVALLVIVLLVLAAWKLPHYSLSPVDGPDIDSLELDKMEGWILVGIDVAVILLWAFGSRWAAPLFLYVAVPLMTIQGVSGTSYYLGLIDPRWPPDQAGKFAHSYVPKAELGQITVAATGFTQILRTQFYIDHPDVAMLELPKDAPIEAYQVPVRNKWLLTVGNHPLPPALKPVAATADYTLVKLSNSRRPLGTFRFSDALHGGLVAGTGGLSVAEPWGRWSDSKQVVLHFAQPLPKRAQVVLKAQAFGPNIGLPFTMHVGGTALPFRLSDVPQDVNLMFPTDGAQRSLAIDIPQPTAPADISASVDTRKLGLGLIEIEVSALDE